MTSGIRKHGAFCWTAESMEMPGFTYTSFKLGEVWVAGMMQIMPEMGEAPPHPLHQRGHPPCGMPRVIRSAFAK